MLFKISSKLLLSISSLGVSKSVERKGKERGGGALRRKACISAISPKDQSRLISGEMLFTNPRTLYFPLNIILSYAHRQ